MRLRDFILSEEVTDLADQKMASGEWREDWVRYVRAYHIVDFSQWEMTDSYAKELNDLLRDLKQPAPRASI